jgi:dolichol-phosphate mannosyltransferase
MKLSLLIPARNEGAAISGTVYALSTRLHAESIPHEILAVEDHSTDSTVEVLERLTAELREFRWIRNSDRAGYGYAVRAGLNAFAGDAVCIVMADASDDPEDVVTYYRKLEQGYECVFGSRFSAGARVENYPWQKLILNRMANLVIRLMFGLRYNDTTNAFKCFRREVIDGIQPIVARHFNMTVELPLKAIVRGYSYVIVPTHWYGRTKGVSKLRIQEMGSRYLFTILYVLFEKLLTRGDYRRSGTFATDPERTSPLPSASEVEPAHSVQRPHA